MATSVQRLLVMLVLMNVLVVFVVGFASNAAESEYENELDRNLVSYRTWGYDFDNQVPIATIESQSTFLEKQFGDMSYGQLSFWKILRSGLGETYFGGSCSWNDCDKNYVRWFTNGLRWIFVIINVLMGLELIYLIANRKYT